MATVGGIPPIESRRLELKLNRGVGGVIKDIADSKPPEDGVTRFDISYTKKWIKTAKRYQYCAGTVVDGKNVGGKFTSAPPDAPAKRKAGFKKKSLSRKAKLK